MSDSISLAKGYLNKMFDISKENDNKKNKIEKTINVLEDLENSIILNDKDIFYMKYKNTIQLLESF